MSSYKYVNGCYVVTTDILPGFERFRKCNAQYRVLYIEHDIIYQFVSYATKILQLTHNAKYDTWRGVTPSVSVYYVSDNVKIDIISHDYLCDVWRA